MINPIINNRIVNDITFALRLKSFLERTEINDAASDEEKRYLLTISNELLEYQKFSATDESEIQYLKINKVL